MSARAYLWYADHRRWGRLLLLVAAVDTMATLAVCAAPQASAAPNAMVLNWTGLRDTYGVPIGDYYFAFASVGDQIASVGTDVTWNPDTWVTWMNHAMVTLVANMAAINILTAEAGLFIGIVAMALWLLKVTVSTYWLTVIGEVSRAIAGAVIQVTTAWGLLLIAVPVGVFVGVVTLTRGEAGRGATRIGLALTLPAMSVALFEDPAGLMYGPDGLLAFGRRVGFSVASAATHNGALAGAGDGVDTLTASLITHTVREPLQLWNFGHVVDRVGSCGPAWSAAVSRGQSDGPITAMAGCGDRAAVTFAQHLDGTNVWVGLVLVAAAGLFAVFLVASGWAVLTASVKAVWTTVIVLPSLWLGAIPGAPQRRAAEVVWQFFRHGIEVLVYIVYVSVIGLAVQRIVSAPLPPELGGTSPFAHVLMMGGVAAAALLLLRHIRSDLSGHPRGGGLLRQATGVAVGVGVSAAVGGVGTAALAGARGLRRPRAAADHELTPWEQMAAPTATATHGAPQPGFDAVPGAPHFVDAPAVDEVALGQVGPELTVDQGGAVATDLEQAGTVAAISAGQGSSAASARRRTPRTDPVAQPDPPPTAAPRSAVPEVAPMLETGYRGPIPLPEPPAEHEPPPAPEDGPTTVDLDS